MNLSQAQTRARAEIEKTYIGTCDVIEYGNIVSNSAFTKKGETTVYSGIPCRLSYNRFNNMYPSATSETAASASQQIKLFLAPETIIKSGSKIVVTQNGVTTAFKSSSAPSYYVSHQEITLELFDKWT